MYCSLKRMTPIPGPPTMPRVLASSSLISAAVSACDQSTIRNNAYHCCMVIRLFKSRPGGGQQGSLVPNRGSTGAHNDLTLGGDAPMWVTSTVPLSLDTDSNNRPRLDNADWSLKLHDNQVKPLVLRVGLCWGCSSFNLHKSCFFTATARCTHTCFSVYIRFVSASGSGPAFPDCSEFSVLVF